MDIKLFHNPGELSLGQFDVKREGLVLAMDRTLETAVIISLFTDRRARADELTPPTQDAPRGWWGDLLSDIPGDEIGSWLWLLYREKATDETLGRAREYALEALQWLVEDGVARSVNVKTGYRDRLAGVMDIDVAIDKREGSLERYNLLWRHLSPQYEAQTYSLLTGEGERLLTESNERVLRE